MGLTPELDWCRGENCNLLLPIVNKHYGLCVHCNFKRTHHGKTEQQVAKERHEKRHKNIKPDSKQRDEIDKRTLIETLKKKFSIKRVSNKKAERDRLMKQTYHKIDTTRDPVCEGCGRNLPLSHSHILSQANRPDLAADEDNIRLHCFGSYHNCHEKWERGDPFEISQMDDFKDNIAYVEMMDKDIFRAVKVNLDLAGIKI